MRYKSTNFWTNKKIKFFLFNVVLLILSSSKIFANPSYKMTIEDISITDDNKVEASIYLENVGEKFELTSYQCALSINQSIDLSSLSLTYIEGSTELLNGPDLYVGIDNIDGPTELTFVSYIGIDIISKKTLVGRFCLEGNIDISKINLLDIQWDFEGTISTIITGKDFANITNPESHESVFASSTKEDPSEKKVQLKVMEVTASNGSSSANRVIDGKGYADDNDSRWAQEGMPASLVFDLGESCHISKTRFSFFHFAEGRIYQYSVRVSKDNENWIEVVSNVSSEQKEWSEQEFSSVEGRYVELEIHSSTGPNGGKWATVWEAEIWGIGQVNSVEEIEETVEEESIPNEYGISQNYPNPFNPTTKVEIRMKDYGSVRLDVYNLLGERVLELVDQELSAGVHEISIDGSRLASGVYIYQLVVNNEFSEIKKMNLMK